LVNNLLFCSFYYRSNLKTGANKRFENIISSLKAHLAKDQKIIVLIKKGNISDYFISDKIEVHELPEFPFLDRFITFILYSIKLISFERLIVVSDFMPIPLLALSKHIHFQLIHDIRNFTEFRRVDYLSSGQKIQKRQWGKCQNIITVSNFTKKQLVEKCGIDSGKILVSPNGIDDNYLAEIPANNRDIDILYIATFENRKNHRLLIQALENYSGTDTIRVCLIGKDLGTKNDIVSHASGLDNNIEVDFIDHVGNEGELIDYYNRAHLFVCPSLYEGFGMPVIEALSRGCRVLCTDIEVFREIGGKSVEYFAPNDSTQLLKQIEKNLSKKIERDVDSQFFEPYKWSKIAGDLLELLSKKINNQN